MLLNDSTPESHVLVVPTDINLVFLKGSSKLMLMSQQLIIHVIVSDSIKTLHTFLLFHNAFPDVKVVFSFA